MGVDCAKHAMIHSPSQQPIAWSWEQSAPCLAQTQLFMMPPQYMIPQVGCRRSFNLQLQPWRSFLTSTSRRPLLHSSPGSFRSQHRGAVRKPLRSQPQSRHHHTQRGPQDSQQKAQLSCSQGPQCGGYTPFKIDSWSLMKDGYDLWPRAPVCHGQDCQNADHR